MSAVVIGGCNSLDCFEVVIIWFKHVCSRLFFLADVLTLALTISAINKIYEIEVTAIIKDLIIIIWGYGDPKS
jgi:hypothetical protein